MITHTAIDAIELGFCPSRSRDLAEEMMKYLRNCMPYRGGHFFAVYRMQHIVDTASHAYVTQDEFADEVTVCLKSS